MCLCYVIRSKDSGAYDLGELDQAFFGDTTGSRSIQLSKTYNQKAGEKSVQLSKTNI